MEFNIKTKNIDLTDAIRSAVEQKLGKLDRMLERFGDAVLIEVEVGKTSEHHNKGPYFRAEIQIWLPDKHIYVDSQKEDLYMAIREARDKAERQIREFREMLEDSQKGGLPDIGMVLKDEEE